MNQLLGTMHFSLARHRVILTVASLVVLHLFASPTISQAAPQPAKKVASPSQAKSVELNERAVAAAKSKDFNGAEKLFREALATDSHNLTAAFNLSGMYLTNEKIEPAIVLLKSYASKYPHDAGIYVRLGDAYFASKRVDTARVAYEKAFSLDKKYVGLPVKLATTYSLLDRLKDAETMLRKAVSQAPKDGQILANFSSILLANGKPDEAISTAKQGLQMKATSELYITLGAAYEMRKEYKNSLIAFERARDMGNSSDELAKKISQIKKAAS